jgi:calcium-translocating P-type ATPase
MSVGQIILGDGTIFSSVRALSKSQVYDSYLLSAIGNSSASVGISEGKRRAVGGNSTERAILDSVLENERSLPSLSVIEKLPFDSERKFSSALVAKRGERRLFIKGAPEKLMPFARFYLDEQGVRRRLSSSRLEEYCRSLSREGKRLLLIAEANSYDADTAMRGRLCELCVICVITLEDKIRKAAPTSVRRLRGAGIHVVMITGDNKDTAEYIAKQCGIIGDGVDTVLTGAELSAMSDARLKELLPRLGAVARALPADKSRLVRLSQELELVTGMTGDGINDAPALKRADVGFSMGSGTQVAKDAGDVVILDNDLSSIVKAVLYGRNIFKSIRKFISLQLMMNLCAVGVSIIGPFIGYDAPVTVVQMLWINIIMDTLGGLAFAGEAALDSYMSEKPKRRDEPILNGYMIYEIVFGGVFTVGLCVAFLKNPAITSRFRSANDSIFLLTAFFVLFIFSSVFNCFCARTDRLKLFSGLARNRGFILIMGAVLLIQIGFVYLGGQVLRTAPLTLSELGFTALLALSVFPADFLRKLLWRALSGKKGY